MCPLVCHCPARFGGIQVSTGLACALGSPNVSTDAGILMGYQKSGNTGYAHMHESLELLLVWKLVILLYARDGILFEGVGVWMGQLYTC